MALLPVDSEHSAIFQCLQAGERKDVQRLILTASGGPFRDHTKAQLEQVTLQQALRPRTQIIFVVKADAYGHGALPVAWTAIESGCAMLGVGDSGEAIELREAGLDNVGVVFQAYLRRTLADIEAYGVDLFLAEIGANRDGPRRVTNGAMTAGRTGRS